MILLGRYQAPECNGCEPDRHTSINGARGESTARGWCTREWNHVQCRLCGGKVDPRDVPGHGRQHIAAIEGQYQSFWVVLSMAIQPAGKLYEKDVGDVVEEISGFRPGTPEAKQFWQEHGGTEPP